MRQRRQPLSRARRGTRNGACRARGARLLGVAARAAAAGRERAPLAGGRASPDCCCAGSSRRALVAAAPAAVARAGSEALERSVLAFSFGVAVLAGIGFGVAPAIQATRPDLEGMLRESGRGGSGSRRQTRARNALVVCQVALALVLLVGAGLLLRSVRPAAFRRAWRAAVARPDVRRASADGPLRGRRAARAGSIATSRRDSRAPRRPRRRRHLAPAGRPARITAGARGEPIVPTRRASPRHSNASIEGPYFEAVGIPLLRGRTFGPEDDAEAPRRVVISQELARQLFPSDDPIGKRLRVAGGAGRDHRSRRRRGARSAGGAAALCVSLAFAVRRRSQLGADAGRRARCRSHRRRARRRAPRVGADRSVARAVQTADARRRDRRAASRRSGSRCCSSRASRCSRWCSPRSASMAC